MASTWRKFNLCEVKTIENKGKMSGIPFDSGDIRLMRLRLRQS